MVPALAFVSFVSVAYLQHDRSSTRPCTAFGNLNTIRYDPISGQASHKEICVRVRKA